ncbi:hypothetical protein BAY61_29155 [Prauserella marina]|uniref:choice-of-anchor P family protein n=1 Tax=Prauserella marina TaxID=530584 RepID=UPI000B86BDEF|nr:choice-of-anchor P family protein [Prauserella marina]ASR38394.1 hypothetical protein BAY61_29155 [Prauserella marina]
MSKRRLAACGVAAASAALTAGMLFAPAASADEAKNSAFALSATGLIKIDPVPYVDDTNGAAEKSVAEIGAEQQLAHVELLNARAGDGFAKSSVAGLSLDLSPLADLGLSKPLLSAEAVEATCDNGVGSSSLANAKLGDIPLDVSAPPNTGVEVPGVASVLLNKQTQNDDGSLTVTAISIEVNGLQTIDVASATCAEAAEVPEQPEPTDPPGDDDNGGDDGDNGDNGGDNGDNGGSQVGAAPVPTPVKAHLDVTG